MKNENLFCKIRLMNGTNIIREVHSSFLIPNSSKLNIGAFYYCELTKCGCELLEVLEYEYDEDDIVPTNIDEALFYNGISWHDFI